MVKNESKFYIDTNKQTEYKKKCYGLSINYIIFYINKLNI